MRRVIAWFRSHPLTTGLLLFVGVIFSLHLFANWRAEVRWQRYCTEARARGVKLTLTEFATPEIPDAENFAALPMFRAIFNGGVQRPLELPSVSGARPSLPDLIKGEKMDWPAFQKYCQDAGWISEATDSPPRDVLRGLEHYAPQFQQWREWPDRPKCRFPLELDKGFAMPLPHLSTLMDAAKHFSLRMRAHLTLGDSAAAYVDFRDGSQAYRALRGEPTFISGLVRISVLTTMLNGVGEGMRDRAWNEAELKKIDAEMATISIWPDYLFAIASERAFGNWVFDRLATSSPRQRSSILNNSGGIPGLNYPVALLSLIPKRLFRDNQLRQNQYFDELAARVTQDGQHFDPDLPTPSDTEHMTGFLDQYYFFLCRLSQPVYGEVIKRYVSLQTRLDEARLAIALERFHLARGTYPETLTELVPEFIPAIPADTYSKKALIYRRQQGATFLLYGVGENRTDDGGVINPKLVERRQLDEIWIYAPPPQ